MQRRQRTSWVSIKFCDFPEKNFSKIIDIEFSPNDRFSDLKSKIQQIYDIPVRHQTLWRKLASDASENVAINDSDLLAESGIRMGWKSRFLQMQGDIIELQTALPMKEYFPGGKHWCDSYRSINRQDRSRRLSIVISICFLCILVLFSLVSIFT